MTTTPEETDDPAERPGIAPEPGALPDGPQVVEPEQPDEED